MSRVPHFSPLWHGSSKTASPVKPENIAFSGLVHFNPGLQNGFTLQCLDLRKIDEAEAGISRAKEAGFIYFAQIEAL